MMKGARTKEQEEEEERKRQEELKEEERNAGEEEPEQEDANTASTADYDWSTHLQILNRTKSKTAANATSNFCEENDYYDIEASRTTTGNNKNHDSIANEISATAFRHPFPREFYDPKTKRIMIDPVVAPNGDSYERSSAPEVFWEFGGRAVVDGSSGDVVSRQLYYPNRALQIIIQQELNRFDDAGASVQGELMKWNKKMKVGFQKLLEKSAMLPPGAEHRPLIDAFYCPISCELIHEPVIGPDGHTYEKSAILQWLQHSIDSPVTRDPLTAAQLRDNNNLLGVLEFLTQQENGESMHPSVRQWKQEHSTRIGCSSATVPPSPPPPPATATATFTGYNNNTPFTGYGGFVASGRITATNSSAPSRTNPASNSTLNQGRRINYRSHASNQTELDALDRHRTKFIHHSLVTLPIATVFLCFIIPASLRIIILLVFAVIVAVCLFWAASVYEARRAELLENDRNSEEGQQQGPNLGR